ncbi:L-lactate dehydrogenase complex protein LldG [Georgenia soli]|uniref:L-lactate dehydrogenase complex protein LldG n=1 Tax=Georgenia soli TaxID=638953 RepID=A0A2A9EMJ0_9MICO|nr:lactate utilization protein C [Georgenia soli]PFG40307.1 L-lactate dehydrogenase complex protein LldG [Georgenia soli]
MDAREAILARVRDALGRSQTEPAPPVPRGYRAHSDVVPGSGEAVDLLVDRLVDYRANVHRCREAELADTLGDLLGDVGSVVVPPGLPPEWVGAATAGGARTLLDTADEPLPNAALDTAGAVLTAARVAIAETGTIVLDGEPDQGRRAITLVPDRHVCVLHARQVVATVPEAVAVLGQHPHRPMTWVAGPSATSDIELIRVEGVHGPRTLDVVIVT